MRQTPDGLTLSATDVSNALSCRHLTGLDMEVAAGLRKRPFRPDPLADILRDRGLAHEAAYVEALRGRGLDVVDVRNDADREGATLAAMAAGRDVIVQGALRDGRWFGLPDVLLKVARPGRWDWSYEAVDTKLAQETKAAAILQLGLYSELLKTAQGVAPEFFTVVTPKTLPAGEVYRVDDYAAYVRLIRRRLEETAALPAAEVVAANYPEPVNHCDVCAFWSGCDSQRRTDDHLSLIAGASRSQRRELEDHDITTLTDLAGRETLDFKPKRGALESLLRVRDQAKVQFRSRGLETPLHELRPRVEKQGFERLPVPSPGDVFLDLEGDPFAVEGGREYLFGLVTVGDDGAPRYQAWWAITHAEEARAFGEVVDFIEARRAVHPDMHVYHYAPYEPSAFKRLMGRHVLRQSAIDALLRGGHFVDLYAIVTQSLLAGVERYSIKNLEPLYGFKRAVPLEDARGGLRAMERCLETGVPEIDAAVRDTVQGYNEDDCVSTLRLRDWLERLRAAEIANGVEIPRPAPEESDASDKVDERARRVDALRTRLLDGVPAEPSARSEDQQARWLLAYMLDWHRREDKAAWWEYFRLRDMPDDDLYDERQAVAGLEFVERAEERRNKKGVPSGPVVDRYQYPAQEMEMRVGDTLKSKAGTFGKLVALDRDRRLLDVEKAGVRREQHPLSAFGYSYVNPQVMEEAIHRLSARILEGDGTIGEEGGSDAATRRLLRATPPRWGAGSVTRRPEESIVEFSTRAVLSLDQSVLPIQGPPGAGKTYAGARMIVELVRSGKKVGVTATSHKVIRNLLSAVTKVPGATVSAGHLPSKKEPPPQTEGITNLESNDKAFAAMSSGGHFGAGRHRLDVGAARVRGARRCSLCRRGRTDVSGECRGGISGREEPGVPGRPAATRPAGEGQPSRRPRSLGARPPAR
jgi:predicted RecB family nuclease